MSLYRNKDVNKPKPTNLITAFLLLAGGIAVLFQQDFATPLRMVVVSSGAAATMMALYGIWLWLPARMRTATKHIVEQHRKEQGRLTHKEAEKAGLLMEESGLPLASLQENPNKRGDKMVGLTGTRLEGHGLIVGATRSGKGMHLTQTLLSSDCAAVVIDPKGEQYGRTAGYRAEHVGPVYKIPGHTMDLAEYYNLAHNDHLTELHFHLMKPWADKQSIFADKVKFVFAAAQAYARDNRLNPLHVLLDAANSSPADALTALMDSHYDAVMNFTNGDEPDGLDKFAASSWGSFGTRMFDYQQHWHTITTGDGLTTIPKNWAAQKGTIYITYPFDQLKGVGGIVSAIVAALLRYQKMHDRKDKILAAVDELPAVGLRNVDEYLATVGGYGITMLLYVQTYSQLADMYGERRAETILSNCQHQVWYPPADSPTAKRMSELYGTKVEPFQSFTRSDKDRKLEIDFGSRENSRGINMQIRPALAPEEMEALDKEEVIVRLNRRHILRAYRLWPVPVLAILPPPAYEIQTLNPVRPKSLWAKKRQVDKGFFEA